MARNTDGEVTEIWAETGDTAIPPVTFVEGWDTTYSQTGGPKPERTSFNFLLKQLYSMGKDITDFGGGLPYSATIDFEVDAIVTSAGKAYLSLQANGPTTAIKDPATEPSFWSAFGDVSKSITQTFTAPQRTTVTVDSDGSFDMDVAQDFNWTPTGSDTLQFTNEAQGQSGLIYLNNPSGYTISMGSEIMSDADIGSVLSIAGQYLIGYHCFDGVNVAVTYSQELS